MCASSLLYTRYVQLQYYVKNIGVGAGGRGIDPFIFKSGRTIPLTFLAKLCAKITLHGRSLATTNELSTQTEYNAVICRFKTVLA